MIVEYMPQCSDEWFAAHAGVPGASSFDQVLTSQGKPSAQRQKLIYRLAGEMLIGKREEGFCSPPMRDGTEKEAEARAAFSFITGLEVEQVGFIYHDDRKRWGCSPDGLIVGQKQGLEIKAPTLPVHISYLDKGKLPTDYFPQVQGSMAVTGYDAWHFFSYYPECRPLRVVVDRDEEWIATFKQEIEKLCDEVQAVYQRLK
jgi:exodeoxyribonuclease (lambda-induced)